MSGPIESAFRTRLAGALERARIDHEIAADEFEQLLLDPGFDAAVFARFRREAAAAGVHLPVEDDEEIESRSIRQRPVPAESEPRDLLDVYLAEIGRFPLLPHPEVLRLTTLSRQGDEDALRRLIVANLRLVVHIARDYRNRGLTLPDLIAEGNLGLIHAVDRFEPERELRLSTYAAIWIRQSILRAIAEQGRAVRIPVQMFQQMNRFVRAERNLRARFAREPRSRRSSISRSRAPNGSPGSSPASARSTRDRAPRRSSG